MPSISLPLEKETRSGQNAHTHTAVITPAVAANVSADSTYDLTRILNAVF